MDASSENACAVSCTNGVTYEVGYLAASPFCGIGTNGLPSETAITCPTNVAGLAYIAAINNTGHLLDFSLLGPPAQASMENPGGYSYAASYGVSIPLNGNGPIAVAGYYMSQNSAGLNLARLIPALRPCTVRLATSFGPLRSTRPTLRSMASPTRTSPPGPDTPPRCTMAATST